MNSTKTQSAPRAWPRWVRLGIVALFAVILASTFAFARSTSPAPAHVVASGPVQVLAAGSDYTVDGSFVQSSALGKYTKSRADAKELLPAYRWSGQTAGLKTKINNVTQLTEAMTNNIANFFFTIASMIWVALLAFLDWALTIDPLVAFSKYINSTFKAVTDSLWKSGAIAVLLGVTMLVIIKKAASGGKGGVVRLAVMCIIPLAAMQVLADAANQGEQAPMSPTWLATQGSEKVTKLGTDTLVALTGKIAPVRAKLSGGGDASGDRADCQSYMGALNADYAAARGVAVAESSGSSTGQIVKDVDTASGVIQMTSKMWEQAYLNNWERAQFGDNAWAPYVSCQYLELLRGTPTAERYAVVGGSGDNAPSSGAFAGWGSRPFTAMDGVARGLDIYYAPVFAWAACSGSGDKGTGTQLASGWNIIAGAENPAQALIGSDDKGPTAEQGYTTCAGWSRNSAPEDGVMSASDPELGKNVIFKDAPGEDGGGGEGSLRPDDGDEIDAITRMSEGRAKDASKEDKVALATVRDVYISFTGNDPGQRALGGIVSLLGAGIYAYCLLGLAIGAIVAQVGFAILLALLPVSLFLAAFSRDSGPNGNPGIKMLKTTVGLGLSKLVMLAMMTIIIISTVLIDSLGKTVGGGLGGGLLSLAAPLVSLILVKKLAERLGFGNLTSPGGAVGMATTAAASMSGNKGAAASLNKGFSKFDRAGKKGAKTALGGLDSLAAAAQRRKKRGGAKDPTKDEEKSPGLLEKMKTRAGAAKAALMGAVHDPKGTFDSMRGRAKNRYESIRGRMPWTGSGIPGADLQPGEGLGWIAKGKGMLASAATAVAGSSQFSDADLLKRISAGAAILGGSEIAGRTLAAARERAGVEPGEPLPNLSSGGSSAQALAWASANNIPPAYVLPSPTGSFPPLAIGSQGAGSIPIVFSADGEVDVTGSLRAAGVGALLSAGVYDAVKNVAGQLQTNYDISAEAAHHHALSSAGQVVGAIDSNNQTVDIAGLVNLKDVGATIAAELAKNPLATHVVIDNLSDMANRISQGKIQQIELEGARGAALRASSVDRTLDPDNRAVLEDSKAYQRHAEEIINSSVAAVDGGANYESVLRGIDQGLAATQATLVALAAQIDSQANSRFSVDPGAGATIAAEGQQTLENLTQAVANIERSYSELQRKATQDPTVDRSDTGTMMALADQVRQLGKELRRMTDEQAKTRDSNYEVARAAAEAAEAMQALHAVEPAMSGDVYAGS